MKINKEKKIRIGCASAFWGDTTTAAEQLVNKGHLDYLVFDFLSEVTMSILAGAKMKNPQKGYASDFVKQLIPLLGDINNQGLKVIANAGGINLESCRDAIQAELDNQDLQLKIAIVSGDNLINKKEKLAKLNITEMESGIPLPDSCLSINAYLGSSGIRVALENDADIVITGRCVDSAMVLAPLMYEFNWSNQDYNLLASGSLAGHIIECGAQCTGGNFTDWESVKGFENMGFPIIEVQSNGDFIVSKPPKTGGMVSFGTVAEQFLYEIGNPNKYFLPDVVCDFTSVKIIEIKKDQVLVTGAKGYPPSNTYKVSSTYMDGFRVAATLVIGGINASKKAEITANAILKKTKLMLQKKGLNDFKDSFLSKLGTNSIYGLKTDITNSKEVVMRLMVTHNKKEALEIFSKEIAQAVTGMVAGVMNYFGGRPKISSSIRLFSFLLDKKYIEHEVIIDSKKIKVKNQIKERYKPKRDFILENHKVYKLFSSNHTVPLEKLAFARSGDKGDHSNIGVIARDKNYLPFIRDALQTEVVSDFFKHVLKGPVKRWEVPGINGLNFLLMNSLGGGGMASLYIDPQGKAYAQMLLEIPIAVPKTLAQKLNN